MMVFANILVIGLVLLAPVSSTALLGQDIDGTWKRLSWEKRSNRGDVLRLPLANYNDQSYSVPVRMGTPFQNVQMAVSLSQNYIVVASPNTNGESGFYNPTQSSSYAPGSATANLQDNNGQTITANFVGESCQVSDFNYDAQLAITPASANVNNKIYPQGCHGILGYGIDAPATPANNTLLGVYLPPGFKSAICGIELNWSGDDNQGIFTMGGTDSTAFTGGFTKMIVPPATAVNRPSWSIPVDGIHVAVDQGVHIISANVASIDPYYPNIELPASAVALLYSKVANAAVSSSNSNIYTVPCDAKIQPTMIFGGNNFTMDPRDAIRKENGTCYGTIQASSSMTNIYKIGSPFMRNVYTTFGVDVTPTGAVANVAFATKVLRAGAHSSSLRTSVPSLSISLVVLACTFMIVA